MSQSLPPDYRTAFDEAIANLFSNPKYNKDYLFYAHIIGQCQIHFDPTLQAPAGVNFTYDHYNLYINPLIEIPLKPNKEGNYPKDGKGVEHKSTPGFNGLPLEHRLGVLKHEMLHIISNHISRKQDRNHIAFNYATDCAINQFIDRKHLPEGCILPDNFPATAQYMPVPEKCTAEQYYSMLDFQDDNNGNGSCGGAGSPIDDHSTWDTSVGDQELQEDITKNMLEKAVSQTQKSQGNIPAQITEWLDNLTKKREIDWKQVLRKLVGNRKANIRRTLMRPDRRLPDMAHIKGKTKDRIGVPLVIGDESGSVSSEELSRAIGECLHICKQFNAPLWYVPVDTVAHKPHMIKSNQRTFKRSACGGTILAPALEMIRDAHLELTALVIITDGYIDDSDVEAFAATRKQVIFLITSEGKIPNICSSFSNIRTFKLKG